MRAAAGRTPAWFFDARLAIRTRAAARHPPRCGRSQSLEIPDSRGSSRGIARGFEPSSSGDAPVVAPFPIMRSGGFAMSMTRSPVASVFLIAALGMPVGCTSLGPGAEDLADRSARGSPPDETAESDAAAVGGPAAEEPLVGSGSTADPAPTATTAPTTTDRSFKPFEVVDVEPTKPTSATGSLRPPTAAGSDSADADRAATPSRAASSDALASAFTAADRDPGAIASLVREASRALKSAAPSEASAIGDHLEPYAKRLFFDPLPLPGREEVGRKRHAVAAGEYPWKIAKNYAIDPHLIALLNPGADATHLRIDQRLDVLDLTGAELEIVVDRTRHRLTLFATHGAGKPAAGERLMLMHVPVAVGRAEARTPIGVTKITRRVRAVDDRKNAAWPYRLDLDGAALDHERITIQSPPAGASPDWLGAAVTDGSLWMRTEDLTRLGDCVREGVTVTIRG
jgi:hypothetical protein